MIQAITGILCGIGLYLIAADYFKIPYFKTSAAVADMAKKQKGKNQGFDIWLGGIARKISEKIKINEFRRAKLEGDLKTAQMDISPEMFTANAIVKAMLVGAFAVPVLFLFPILSPVIIFLAFFLYGNEMRSVGKRIGEKRTAIEYELPRLVFTIEKTLKHSRDVLYMLDSYRDSAGPELRHELDVTVADMKSGNYEGAITRLESRVGSSMMSDICRGLIGILRGDDTEMYWASLGIKFGEYQRQMLRMRAAKVPKKVNRLSLCLLICFLLTYVVVILDQIVNSVGILFG